MQQTPNWKHLSVHIKYIHKATAVQSTEHWSDCGDSEMKSLVGVESHGIRISCWHTGSLLEWAGKTSFYARGRALVLFTFYTVFSAVNPFQFQLQKGRCLKKYFILHNFHRVFLNLFFRLLFFFFYFYHLGIFRNQTEFFSFPRNPSPPIHRNVTCTSFSRRRTLHL